MAKLEVEIKLDTEALVRELMEAAEKIEAEEMEQTEKDRINAWLFNWHGMVCSNCHTTFSDELVYMNRDEPLGTWIPMFCPECGAKVKFPRLKGDRP